MSVCLFVFCLLVSRLYSLYASGCLLSSLFLIKLLWVYLSKKEKGTKLIIIKKMLLKQMQRLVLMEVKNFPLKYIFMRPLVWLHNL